MAKIFKFRNKSEKVEDFLRESNQLLKEEEVISVVIAGKTASGQWCTAYHNVNFAERAEAIAHINADLIDSMIRANPERYNLYTHEDL